ncbi:phosphate transport system regulatory protein [Bdellovibrio bacteriovorus W]|nr:phosphate transport system regulatory protein [Bdellovibrio bacteriovorus W]
MERALDSQIEDLKKMILLMGGHVEKSLAKATAALLSGDLSKFEEVHDTEKLINKDHINVDNACMNILAKQGPVAKDLRLVLSIVKINNDLERMGDQAVNISYSGKDYLKRKSTITHSTLNDIQRMSEIAGRMVKDSLDCFVRGDVEHAKKILLMDDEIDMLRNKVFDDAKALMRTHPDAVDAGLDLILIARNLERLGDHATNVAEDVIFAFTGKDIRHGGKIG